MRSRTPPPDTLPLPSCIPTPSPRLDLIYLSIPSFPPNRSLYVHTLCRDAPGGGASILRALPPGHAPALLILPWGGPTRPYIQQLTAGSGRRGRRTNARPVFRLSLFPLRPSDLAFRPLLAAVSPPRHLVFAILTMALSGQKGRAPAV